MSFLTESAHFRLHPSEDFLIPSSYRGTCTKIPYSEIDGIFQPGSQYEFQSICLGTITVNINNPQRRTNLNNSGKQRSLYLGCIIKLITDKGGILRGNDDVSSL